MGKRYDDAMKRWQKITVSIVGLLFVMALSTPLWIPTQKIKSIALQKIQEQTDYPVHMGDVSIKIIPRLGVSLHDISFGTVEHPIQVNVKQVFVQVQLLPLLSNQIIVDQFRLERPSVMLQETSKHPDAQLLKSDSDQDQKEANVTEASDSTDQPWAFSVNGIEINNGEVIMLDDKKQPALQLSQIQQTLSLSLEGDIIKANGQLGIGHFTYAEQNIRDVAIKLTQKATWNNQSQTLQLDASSLELADVRINLSGQVSQIGDTLWRTDLALTSAQTNTQDLFRLLPLQSLQEQNIDAQGLFSLDAHIKGDWDTRDLIHSFIQSDSSLRVELSQGKLVDTKKDMRIDPIALTLEATPAQIHIPSFSIKAQKSHLNGSILARNYMKDPNVDGSLKGSLVLKDFEALVQSSDISSVDGLITLDVQAKNANSQLKQTHVAGKIQLSDVAVESHVLPTKKITLNGLATLNNKETAFTDLQLNTGQSDLRIQSATLPSLLTFMQTDGPVNFNVSAHSNRLDLQPFVPSQQEESSSEPLVMPDMFYQLNGAIHITAKEILWDGLSVTDATAKGTIKNGVIDFTPLQLTVFEGKSTINGQVSFADRTAGPTFDVDLNIHKIRASQALTYADNVQKLLHIKPTMVDALVSVQGTSKGQLTPQLDLQTGSFSSTGKVSLHEATLAGHPIQNALAKLLDYPSIKKLSIKDRVQKFTVDQGRVNIDNFDINAGAYGFVIDGWQSIDGSQKMDVQAKLPTSMEASIKKIVPATLVNALKQNNQIVIPIQVRGQTTSPSVSVDSNKMGSLAKKAAKDEAKSKLDKAAAPIKDKAKKAAKDLMPKSSKDGGSKKEAEKKIKDKAKDLKKSLKGLF